MANLLQSEGSHDTKDNRWAPIFTNRYFVGLWTNRNPLRAPTGVIYERYYRLGGTDALIDGLNTELSDQLTMIRRPGNPQFGSITLSSKPDQFFSFQEQSGTIRVLADTASTIFNISTTAPTVIYGKNTTAQAYFQGVANTLYIGDGTDLQKWQDFGSGNPGNTFCSVTATSLTSNVATYTAANNLAPGQLVSVSGSTNNAVFDVTDAMVVTANSTQFTVAVVHADITQASESACYASSTWNWGIVAPTTAPTLTVISAGSASQAWVASTVFSTMGLLVDSNGNVEQLTSVNALGTNTTRFGTSSPGMPNFQSALASGDTLVDGTVTWTSWGPIGLWQANHVYALETPIYDPTTNTIQQSTALTSGGTKPNFSAVFQGHTPDGTGHWFCLGTVTSQIGLWKANTTYNSWWEIQPNAITYPVAPTADLINAGQVITLFTANDSSSASYSNSPGTTGTSYSNPNWTGTVGSSTQDNQLLWINLGSATRQNSQSYTAWAAGQAVFSVVKDLNGNMQVCTVGGISAASANAPLGQWPANTTLSTGFQIAIPYGTTWQIQKVTTGGTTGASVPSWSNTQGNTTTDNTVTWTNEGAIGNGVTGPAAWSLFYGGITQDGGVQWTNVGQSMTWTASESWYLPAAGFAPPSSSTPFGGAQIVDSNNNVQFVIESGKTGSSAPSWVTVHGTNTMWGTWGGVTYTTATDLTAESTSGPVWCNTAAEVQSSLTYTKGYSYVVEFKARAVGDALSNSSSNNPINTPPIGSASGTYSNASPSVSVTGSNSTGAILSLTGTGSLDPQVDTISIFRTADGGATYFWLADIPNPAPRGAGIPGVWTFNDTFPDIDLNILLLAAVAEENTPPPAGLINLTYHNGRVWGSVGSTVYASAGPDVGAPNEPLGNGNESFPPTSTFSFNSNVIRLVPSNTGLWVFTTTGIYQIAGGPAMATYFAQPMFIGYGVLSYNAIALNGTVIYFYTIDRRLMALDPNLGLTEIGKPIGDQLFSNFDPASVYLTYYASGSNDQALYIADGSTGWYRCNVNQSPDYAITGPVWSPKAEIVGGCGAIQAVQTAAGTQKLLIGGTGSSDPVLARDSSFTTFTDNGSAYSAFFTGGCIVLANPGQLAELAFITLESVKTGTSPKLSVLLDEINGQNVTISAASQSGNTTTYTYSLISGNSQPVPGKLFTVTGMNDTGNNGSFYILTATSSQFTVNNPNGVSRTGQSGAGTNFEDLSGYVSSTTSLPPQESPYIYGLTNESASTYANRYYFGQSINGEVPQSTCARYLQYRVDFGNSDTVKNEVLTMTIYGAHWQEEHN